METNKDIHIDHIIRCNWPGTNTLAIAYHDMEWGTPLHDDQKHYEFLLLDGFQAGLSWNTILNKRENFRKAFDEFDYYKIALYPESKVEELMKDTGIVRNRLKIIAAITNAKAFIRVIEEFGSFDAYIWQFTDDKTIVNHYQNWRDVPAKTVESDAMSKNLLKRGFKFVGSTICYAYMQAAGMVNDHQENCFRRNGV
jgi:DNA-3-methyladenine glycosylase I